MGARGGGSRSGGRLYRMTELRRFEILRRLGQLGGALLGMGRGTGLLLFCLLGSLSGFEKDLVDFDGFGDEGFKVGERGDSDSISDWIFELLFIILGLRGFVEIENHCVGFKLDGELAGGALLFEGLVITAGLFHVVRVFEKGVHYGAEEFPGLEDGIASIGTAGRMGPSSRCST